MRKTTWVVALGLAAACSSGSDDGQPTGAAGLPAMGAAGSAGSAPDVSTPTAGLGGAPSTGGAGGAQPGAPTPMGTAGANMPEPPAGMAGSDPPSTGGMGGNGAAGTAPSAGGMAGSAVAGSGGNTAPSSGPTLPAVDDPGAAGPFDVRYVGTVSGLSSHAMFVPDAVGSHGKHPAVVWTCGNGGTVSFYMSFLDHLASHGFLVVADKASSGTDRMGEVDSQRAAIAWLVAENEKSGGEFFGKIDVDNIAVMGHSLGSLASFATAALDPHVATSVHFSGGLTGNPVGFDEKWLADMKKPAAFMCGGADSTAGPSCAQDFDKAPPTLPVFYGVLAGASHIGPFGGTPRAGQYGRSGVAWLRWQLADDPAYASWFTGADCTLCKSPWTGKQRNL